MDAVSDAQSVTWFTGLTWITLGLNLALILALILLWRLHRRSLRQERALQAAHRDRDLVLQSISDNVTFLDRDLRIVWTNWADRASGQPEKPLRTGAVCHTVIADQSEPCAGCPVPEVLRTGKAQEGVVNCKDGSFLRLSAAPVMNHKGELVGVVQTARDITEKRRLAMRLQQSQKLEAVGQLAAGVAHDFNNNLQVVLGYADLLASHLPADSEAQSYVGSMNRAGQQAREVVRQLLTFSRKREPRTELMALDVWLREQQNILQRLLGDKVAVSLQVEPDLPPVEADAAQVEQALLNLCTNARDAMPAGGRLDLDLRAVTLSPREVRQLGAPALGTYVVLSVTDEGEGIAPELHDRIFDPFFTTKDVDRGTGLGLATVYGIVTAHHGFLELDSQPGKGTTFRLGWPVSDGASVAPAATDTDSEPVHRILVVDDDPVVRQLALSVLRREGFRVDEAKDGQDALSKLVESGEAYDVVVLDALLNGMNGWYLYRQARRQAPGLRAVLCTSHGPDAVEPELPPSLPELAYLPKPYRASDLAGKVRSLLNLDLLS